MKGSTIKRGATWTAYWFTTDPSQVDEKTLKPKRLQHSKGGFRTQKDARSHLNEVLGKVQAGEYRRESKLTVQQLLEEHWLPAKRMSGRRPATVAQYEFVIEHWLIPILGTIPAERLTPAHVQTFVGTLASQPSARRPGEMVSARSRQLAVGTLKSAYAWGLKSGLLSRDPIATIDRPKVDQAPADSWTVTEARSFLTATRDQRLAFAWALLLTRGLRRGDLCGLRWPDVDLEAGSASIRATRVVVDGKAIESLPKTRRGIRTIPLDANLIGLLRTHWARQAAEKLAAGEAYQDGGWLVADELGKPYSPDTISDWFSARVTALGLRRIPLHGTRHTAASLMLADGVPVPVVAQLLGQDPRVTLATYAHVLPGMAEQAGSALSAALLG